MKTKQVKIREKQITLFRYKDVWVFPFFALYEEGLGSPVAMKLYCYRQGGFEPYCTVTVNLPDCRRGAGCQFIDTNNNPEEILGWLEQHKFGIPTDGKGHSGFCTYPLFNFYKGEAYWQYRKIIEELDFDLND